MKRNFLIIPIFVILSGCAASVASKYGVKQDIDKFNDNQVTVRMTGGVIDADYLGIVSNPAQFNPVVVRSSENTVLATAIHFSLERVQGDDWLNIREGSTATFLLNDGAEKVVLNAVSGNIDYDVSVPQNTVYTTLYDTGVFSVTPHQLEKIAYADSVEVRVSGTSKYIDFPRKPNNHVIEAFLPNLRKFYETEVKPYMN